MKRAIVVLTLASACAGSSEFVVPPPPSPPPDPPVADPTGPTPPETRRQEIAETIHGQTVHDPYRWLEDESSAEVQAWMTAQDEYARKHIQKLPERDAIAARLRELFYLDSVSPPTRRGDRRFYSRTHSDKEKAVVYYKNGPDGEETVLFDPNTWSDDGSVSLGHYWPAWDGNLVAYTLKENNSDEATLYLFDIDKGEKSKVDVIEGAKYASPSWTPDSKGFYYTWLPTDPAIETADRPGFAEVRFHAVGSDPKTDRIVRERTNNPKQFISSGVSRDGRWLLLHIFEGWSSNDLLLKDLKAGDDAPWREIFAGQKAHYYGTAFEGSLYVMTDEGAPFFKIQRASLEASSLEFSDIVPEREGVAISDYFIFGGRLVTHSLVKARSQLTVQDLDGKNAAPVTLPGLGTVSGLVGREDDKTAYFSYESFDVPDEVHELDVSSRQTKLYARIDAPIDPSPYTVEQVTYASKDGTPITMFLVHRKDLVKDGSHRVFLYGYGGFQISQVPRFVSSIYTWLERGGIYAVPNLRGGGEYGEAWHKAGMLLEKQNVFDDFIGAAEYLIDERYTNPEKLVIYGGSNGGLLVGAAMTQRPDLYAGVLCAVPLLDMVRYHQFGSGKTWIAEYGSADDPAQFNALYGYSPYHHVRESIDYPPLLMLSADSDDRVDPLHARKFVAAVQHVSKQPALLRIERNAGHGGADLRKAEVEKGADRYAFALAVTSGKPLSELLDDF